MEKSKTTIKNKYWKLLVGFYSIIVYLFCVYKAVKLSMEISNIFTFDVEQFHCLFPLGELIILILFILVETIFMYYTITAICSNVYYISWKRKNFHPYYLFLKNLIVIGTGLFRLFFIDYGYRWDAIWPSLLMEALFIVNAFVIEIISD